MTTSMVDVRPGRASGKLVTPIVAGLVVAIFATSAAIQGGLDGAERYVTTPSTVTIVLAACVTFLSCFLLGGAGYFIGRLLRNFVRPRALFVRGGFWDIFWEKLFWSIGPQLIGLAVGTFIGIGVGSGVYGPQRPEFQQKTSSNSAPEQAMHSSQRPALI